MGTHFFQRQEKARANTVYLVALFAIAVISIVAISATVGYVASEGLHQNQASRSLAPTKGPDSASVAAITAAAAALVILLGSLYQVLVLRSGGGRGVAESLGGRPITAETASLDEKRLLNVVEEMAIASGTPVPPVYLLDEAGINAFAAGYRPGDAVIGVTRGAVEQLNREELQGVIAHEFSHVLNGDMRLNIRMIGILYGILLISLLGRILFSSLRYMGGRSSGNDRGRLGFIFIAIVVGLVLMIIGGIGAFIGNLIKAATSRQREYLADASAVQFTRNPTGLANALKKIGALSAHSQIAHRNAETYSHLFFSSSSTSAFANWLSTHPPLRERILALEPNWDGKLQPTSLPSGTPAITPGQTRAGVSGLVSSLAADDGFVDSNEVRHATEHVGEPESIHGEYSHSLLAQLDPMLRQSLQNPYTAAAVIFALLIDKDADVAQHQRSRLSEKVAEPLIRSVFTLERSIRRLPDAMRLPIVDLALPSLRQMSQPQYIQFMQAFQILVAADKRLSIFEWTLAQVLRRHLRSQYEGVSSVRTLYQNLKPVEDHVSVLLSSLANISPEPADAQTAFAVGSSMLSDFEVTYLSVDQMSFERLEDSLRHLRRTNAPCREQVLEASAAVICADGVVQVREAELLRGIADLLECPMPPFVRASR